MEIYTVTICGEKFYFSGNLSKEEIKIANKVCEKMSVKAIKLNADIIFCEFLNILNAIVKEPVFQIRIKAVFRIK